MRTETSDEEKDMPETVPETARLTAAARMKRSSQPTGGMRRRRSERPDPKDDDD